MPTRLRIGPKSPLIDALPQGTMFFSALLLFYGVPKGKVLLQSPQLRQSIARWHIHQQNFPSFDNFQRISGSFFPLGVSYGVTTFLQFYLPPIRYFMHKLNMLKSITILFEKRFFAKTWKFATYPLTIKQVISSLKDYIPSDSNSQIQATGL